MFGTNIVSRLVCTACAAISLACGGAGMVGTASAQAPATGVGSQFELTFWQSVSTSEDRGQFEAYLAQYPNGTFSALARAKIATIDRRDAFASGAPAAAPVAAPAAAVAPPSATLPMAAATVAAPVAAAAIPSAPAPAASAATMTLAEQLRALSQSQLEGPNGAPMATMPPAPAPGIAAAPAGVAPLTAAGPAAAAPAAAAALPASPVAPAAPAAPTSIVRGGVTLPAPPEMASVPDINLPEQFCSAVERNTFHDKVFIPAKNVAEQNNRAAIAHMQALRQIYDGLAQTRSGAAMNVVAGEAKSYEAVAAEAYSKSTTYEGLFSRMMSLPIKKCS